MSYIIVEIVRSFGLYPISKLFEAGVKFDILYDYQIAEIVQSFGLDSISELARLKILDESDHYNIGNIAVQIVKSFGIDAIPKFLGIGVKLSELHKDHVDEIAETLGMQSISKLIEASILFKCLCTFDALKPKASPISRNV